MATVLESCAVELRGPAVAPGEALGEVVRHLGLGSGGDGTAEVILWPLRGVGDLEPLRAALSEAPGPPVVTLAATSDDELARCAVEAGAQDHVALDRTPPHILPRIFERARMRHRIAATALELERERARARRMDALSALASGLAHELNTPSQYLADNLGFLADTFEQTVAAVLAGSTPPSEELRDALADVQAARADCEEGMRRIQEVILVLRGFTEPPSAERTPVALREALNSALAVIRGLASERLRIETRWPPEEVFVPGCGRELTAVFTEVIMNACRAVDRAGPGHGVGTLELAVEVDSEGVTILFDDDGEGMDEERCEHAFDPFVTQDPARSGAGLAMVHRTIVKGHDGRVSLERSPLGGLRMRIVLPTCSVGGEAAEVL